MRYIFTPVILFFPLTIFAQQPDTTKVVVNGNCWGNANKQAKYVDLNNGLTGKCTGLNVLSTGEERTKPRIIIRDQRTLTEDDKPLLVVDGVIQELSFISRLNPNDIESVDILKNPTAAAIYGYRGANGVLLITTKQSKVRKFLISDFLDGKPVQGTTIRFINATKADTLQFIADGEGMIATSKLAGNAEYRIDISAVGYKNFTVAYKNTYQSKPAVLLMERDIKTCGEVILNSAVWTTKCCLGCSIKTTRTLNLIAVPGTVTNNQLVIYPNPVIKGSDLQVRIPENETAISGIRLAGIDGRIVYQQAINAGNNAKGKTEFRIQTDPRWSAGIYFLQLVCEKGRVMASGKIIIQ